MTPSDDPQDDSPESDPMGPNPNGLLGFETLGEFLEEDEWKPRKLEEKHAYSMLYSGENGDYRCYAIVRIELEEFLFYTVAPVRIPNEVRPAVAEYITRANYGLRIGNFELDYSDGEVRFKSSFNFEGETLTYGMLRNAMYPAVHSLDRYLPGLMRVSFGGATPLEAIEEIESRIETKDE
jgi:hypothetical protein